MKIVAYLLSGSLEFGEALAETLADVFVHVTGLLEEIGAGPTPFAAMQSVHVVLEGKRGG